MTSMVVAKAVILNSSGEVLLLRRVKTDQNRPGDWDFPGGGIEDDEDFIAGVAREIAEETGLTIRMSDLRLLYAATQLFEANDESITRLLFTATLDTATVRLSAEHDEFRWVDIETALTEFPHPFYGAGLRYARDHNLLKRTHA